MWQIAIRVLTWASTAALGYFINDVGDAAEKVLPITGARDTTTGQFKWWYIFLLLIIVSAVIYFIGKFLIGFLPKSKRR